MSGADAAQPHPSRPSKSSLYLQVLVAVAAGAFLGWLKPEWGVALKPLGEVFVRLIKMLIAPIVFTTVSLGIAHMRDMKKVGRVGIKALVYFEVMSTIALLVGLGVVHLVKPGVGIHADPTRLDPTALEKATNGAKPKGIVEHFTDVIPESFVGAFAHGEILQVLLLAVLVGFALARLGEKADKLVGLLDLGAQTMFGIVAMVMRVAPIGAFGAMAYTVGKYGLGSLGSLAKLMGAFYATSLIFVFVVLGGVCALLGLSIVKLLRYLREELVVVLGTSSSESVLPRMMDKLEHLGCGKSVVRLVIPTGYSFNLDGTSIYLTMAAVFVGQALDVPLSFKDEILLLVVLLLTSKGAAAVTGGGFVTLAATLSSTGTIPTSGLTLLVGIDRFMSEARALVNMIGNAVATLVVAKWEGELDIAQARAVLDAKPPK